MIEINGKYYPKRTILNIGNIVKLENTVKCFYRFDITIDIGGGYSRIERVFSNQKNIIFIKKQRSELVDLINNINK
jgi:hypothetical protein